MKFGAHRDVQRGRGRVQTLVRPSVNGNPETQHTQTVTYSQTHRSIRMGACIVETCDVLWTNTDADADTPRTGVPTPQI